MSDDLAKVLSKYRCKGTLKGSDYLLTRQDAMAFVRDLADHRVLIIGCDLWEPWNVDRTNFVEVVGGGDLVNPRLSKTDVQLNAKVLENFMTDEWPGSVERISFMFADEKVWDLILEYLKC